MKKKILLVLLLSGALIFSLCSVGTKVNAEEDPNADMVAPSITGTEEFTIPNTNLLSIETIKASLNVSDNVDNAEDIILEVVYDSYTNNYSRPGTYKIRFKATDKSGNISTFNVTVNVVDRNAPVFYDKYNTKLTKYNVYKSLDSVLVMSDILGQIKAYDEVNGLVEIEVYNDKYTGHGDEEGIYQIVLKATDKSNNSSLLRVNVTVSSQMPSKTILIDNKLVIVDKNRQLSQKDFHNLIKTMGLYDPSTYSYTTIDSSIYILSSKIEGEYLVGYNISTTSGVENEGVFTVRVIDSRTNGAIKDDKEEQEEKEDDGFIISVLKWCGNLVSGLFGFIADLFK